MFAEIDSYLMKCSMEALEEGVKLEDIAKECACRLGLDEKPNKPQQEMNNVRHRR